MWVIQKVSLPLERISLSLWQAPGAFLRSSEPNSLQLKAPVRGLKKQAENPQGDKPVSVHCNIFVSLLSFNVRATQPSPQSHKGSFGAQIYSESPLPSGCCPLSWQLNGERSIRLLTHGGKTLLSSTDEAGQSKPMIGRIGKSPQGKRNFCAQAPLASLNRDFPWIFFWRFLTILLGLWHFKDFLNILLSIFRCS